MTRTTAFPDVRRADAGTALISSWIVPDPAVQTAAADAVIAAWDGQERPDAMLSLTAFLSADGSHVLHYAQWTDDEAHLAWARARRAAAISPIDEAIPGIRRPGLVRYRRHRSHLPAVASGGAPALLVTPTFGTSGPDTQRVLADTVLDVLADAQVPGLLGAHFHLSQDGSRVLNYAEWESSSAWRAFADGSVSARLAGIIAGLPGVTITNASSGPPHYRLHHSLVNVAPPTRATA
ncbi:antibiotic biosynthesis monooxygenase [Streptomyces sp. NPDC050161]|uniref:antibiotic biosynthesis monooxygenase n=1 Tax=Streptomyces sp. NPDC050161 TaxID=3365604 RepID=UPI00378E4CD2